MNALLQIAESFAAISVEFRLAVVFLVGLVLGSQINRAIYRWSWHPRAIGPWGTSPSGALPRRWSDYIPVVGWFGLDRETAIHGPYYWLRPLLLEFFFAVGLTWLYAWENDGGLIAPLPGMRGVIQLQFVSHAILMSWMMIATCIDFDEKLVPDSLTIPGTLLGLTLAALVPYSLLPDFGGVLLCSSPFPWHVALNRPEAAVAACATLWLWCFALCPKTFYFRRGLGTGICYLFASMIRRRYTWWMLLVACVGTGVTWGVWAWGNPAWQGYLSSLAGLLFGLLLMWSVRGMAGLAMGREALGFGDVTLMAMIGTYTGWQPILMIFVIAPFAGAVIAAGQWFVTRTHEIAYAPYLCVATVIVLLAWQPLWVYWGPLFLICGWWTPVGLTVCLLLMGLMLGALRWFRGDVVALP